ncbi:MAG: SRPBCC family protein [Actinomycetota bacterium]|nr:SRPBCC family protein [Actinomycetota bacterium]
MSTVWRRPGYEFEPAATPPLPPNAYASAEVFADEQQRLFAPTSGLTYVGHDLLLPQAGHRRADGDPRLLLTRDDTGAVRLLANVCTHACRPLVTDDLPVCRSTVLCEYHDWSFRRDGSLIGGRNIDFGSGADGTAVRDRLALPSFPTISWHGFHFAVDPHHADAYAADLARIDADFAERGIAHWLDLDGWVMASTHDDPYRGDWKMFLEVFGDCYHVPPYHPGLASFVDCGSIEWTFGENFHVQFLQLSSERGAKSARYADWMNGLDRYYALRGEATPHTAVAWVGVYPNMMFEVYNGLRVISVAVPVGPDQYVNRVHYCVPADMEQLVPGLPQAIRAAYDETVEEDRTLVETRYDGMLAAASLGLTGDRYFTNLSGPALEAGVAHFHDWWTRRLAQPVG